MVLSEENPIYGPFFGVMGAASAIIFSGKSFFIDTIFFFLLPYIFFFFILPALMYLAKTTMSSNIDFVGQGLGREKNMHL